MLHLILVIHQYGVLNELGLKETFLIYRAIEEALIAKIPEEVHGIVLLEEELREGTRKVSDLITEQLHCLFFCMVINDCSQFAVEKS